MAGHSIAYFARALWYSMPAEVFRGGVKGVYIWICDPARYHCLKKMRPPRKLLVRQKKVLMALLARACKAAGLHVVHIFSRVKTIGSMDRKERLARVKFPDHVKEYLAEDYVGLTMIVNSAEECYRVLDVCNYYGRFVVRDYRPSPWDYIKHPKKSSSAPAGAKLDLIQGCFAFKGFTVLTHVRVMTKTTWAIMKQHRGQRLKEIAEEIRAGNSQQTSVLRNNV